MTVPEPFWSRLPGFRLCTSLWGSLLVIDVARGAPPWVSILLVGLVVALSSLGQSPGLALIAGGIGWLVVTGFVVNDLGVLAVSGWADALRLLVLLGAAELGSLGGRQLEATLASRRRAEPETHRTPKVLAPAGSRPGER